MSWEMRTEKYAEIFWYSKKNLKDRLGEGWSLPDRIRRKIRNGELKSRHGEMGEFTSLMLVGAFVLAGFGAAEAASRCQTRNDLPGQWYFSHVFFISGGPDGLPYMNCKIVVKKSGRTKVNKTSCTDSFGGSYFAKSGGGLSVNRSCRVTGPLVLAALGEGGQPNATQILRSFQPGAEVSVIITLDNLRMVSDKLSMHGSARITFSGPRFPGPGTTTGTLPTFLDVLKR